MKALRSLSVAMTKGFVRDRMAMFFSLVFPLMFLVLFGGLFANSTAPKTDIIQVGPVAVIDQMPDDVRAAISQSMDITSSDDLADAIDQVRTGDVDAAVTQSGSEVTLHFSAADQVHAATVNGTFQAIVQSANISATGQPPAFTLVSDRVEDESLSTIQFVTPGLLGWAIAMSATFGAATNLVVWRKNGLLRRLRLSPIPTSSVVLARVGVSLGVAAVQVAVFLGLGVAAFGLQLAGSWAMVIPLVFAGTLAFLSLGLLAGSISKTEEGAVGMANFVVLPMAFLSGSFFPLDGAPTWLQKFSELLPLRHLNEGMLDTMVRGEGPLAAAVPIIILLGFGAVMTALAAKFFRWDA